MLKFIGDVALRVVVSVVVIVAVTESLNYIEGKRNKVKE